MCLLFPLLLLFNKLLICFSISILYRHFDLNILVVFVKRGTLTFQQFILPTLIKKSHTLNWNTQFSSKSNSRYDQDKENITILVIPNLVFEYAHTINQARTIKQLIWEFKELIMKWIILARVQLYNR